MFKLKKTFLNGHDGEVIWAFEHNSEYDVQIQNLINEIGYKFETIEHTVWFFYHLLGSVSYGTCDQIGCSLPFSPLWGTTGFRSSLENKKVKALG